jgi:HPt (histidine-containing phosphotransfer) domain-containing protein
MYVDEMPDRIEQIREAFQTTDRDRLIRLIHQLKGAAGSYGFATLTEEAAVLEQKLLDGDGTNEDAAIAQLLETCEKVRPGIGE